MNTSVAAQSSMLTTDVSAIQQRTEGGNDDTNGSSPIDVETTKSKSKKKKNKKRNSRASLTTIDDLPTPPEEDEVNGDEVAPSPMIAVANPNESAAVTTDIDWASPAKDTSSELLLDLPSPAPVSTGSPFDAFDADINTTTNATNHETSTTILPPPAPMMETVVQPTVDLTDMFAAPTEAPIRRPPPPPVPVDFGDFASEVTPTVVESAPATPFDVISTTEVASVSPVPPIAPALELGSVSVPAPEASPESLTIDPVVSTVISDVEASSVEALSLEAAPIAMSESVPIEEEPFSPPPIASVVPEPSDFANIETFVRDNALEEATVVGESTDAGSDTLHIKDSAIIGDDAHFDIANSSPMAGSPPESPTPLNLGAEVVDATNNSVSHPTMPDSASSPTPDAVGVTSHTSKTLPAPVGVSKSRTNGASHTGTKHEPNKVSATVKQARVTHPTPHETTKHGAKTTTARTPPKPISKPSMDSHSTATPAIKTSAAKAPTLNRSLSGPVAAKKPAKSPTQTTLTGARNGSSSPTTARPSSADNEPKVPKKKLSASEIDAAGNRLYEQAMESKRRLEAKKALREEEFSFTPQVNSKSKKLDNGDAPNRFVLLHERAKEAQRKREELREKLEKEKCTFKPQITNKAKKIASSSDKPRFENLYRNAQEIQAKREEKKQELQREDEELTFKPKIKATKSPVRSRPLYDEELVKQKRLELEQKKLEAQQQAKPKPIKKTRSQDSDNKIFDRLYQAGQQRAERLAKLKQEKEEQEKASATFQPKVSSSAHVKTSKQPFHQRLFDKDHLKRVAAEREQKKIEEEKKRFSFKPQVSELPDSVKSKGSNEGGSTGRSSIFERLYQDKDRVKEKIEMSEELKIQKEMEECTFRPQIDPPTSIAEERDRLKAQLELEACTFRPEISATPGSLSPKRTSSANIFERLSTSAGNTPVDEMKRRPSERKSVVAHGKQNSYNERGSAKGQNAQRPALSVGDILKSSPRHNDDGLDEGNPGPRSAPTSQSKVINGSFGAHSTENVTRSLELELNEPDALASQSKSILENYDSWAASLEEKMRNL